DAALEAGLHLGNVILEATERAYLALVNDDVVAQKPDLRVARTGDAAVGDHATSHRADLRHLEYFADLGRSDSDLFEGWLEQARHAFLDFVGHVVDDRVQADVNLLALGDIGGVAIGPHVESDDDGVRRGSQQHVRFV